MNIIYKTISGLTETVAEQGGEYIGYRTPNQKEEEYPLPLEHGDKIELFIGNKSEVAGITGIFKMNESWITSYLELPYTINVNDNIFPNMLPYPLLKNIFNQECAVKITRSSPSPTNA